MENLSIQTKGGNGIMTQHDVPKITIMTSYDCRKERGNCQICWTTSVDTDIDVSGKPIIVGNTSQFFQIGLLSQLQKFSIDWYIIQLLCLGKNDAMVASVGQKMPATCCSYKADGMNIILLRSEYCRK